jgi:chemotaxis protein CheZ
MRDRDVMPVQRKVFRIEERAHANARGIASADHAEAAQRHHEYIAEIKALRALIEPREAVNRETIERARAQIAEAQAYKHELDLIYAAVKRTRHEMSAADGGALGAPRMARADRELEAIVASTEQATQTVLQSAEDIDQVARTLSSMLKVGHEQRLAHDIQDRLVQIYEACHIQDLTGQRVAKVQETLAFLEGHVARLMQIWHGVETFEPVVLDEAGTDDKKFLNGPRLADDIGHSSQDEIDALFGCA